ncbi:hypothetical protein BH11BAC5_BH11BAC5_09510 [soil metagenome]
MAKPIEMTFSDKHIVKTYSELCEGLSSISKIELIERLSQSLRGDKKNRELNFYRSFGAFASTKTPKEIIAEMKLNRKFRKKEIKF